MPVSFTTLAAISHEQGFTAAAALLLLFVVLGLFGYVVKKVLDAYFAQASQMAVGLTNVNRTLENLHTQGEKVAAVLAGLVAKVEGNIIREDERHSQNKDYQLRQDQLWDEMIRSMREGKSSPRRRDEQLEDSKRRVAKAKKR